MYLFHFTNEEVNHEEVFSWFRERNADWMLNHTFYRLSASRTRPPYSCGVYDISVYDEFIALEFALAFNAVQGESPELKKAKSPVKLWS